MFAVLINIIVVNAGRELAFILQAFFMSAYFVQFRYWYLCTPVYALNGHTAFTTECDEQRVRHRYLLFLLCKITSRIPLSLCSAVTERLPTKRVSFPVFHSTATPCAITIPARGHVDAKHPIRLPCVIPSVRYCMLRIRQFAVSKSRTVAYGFLPVFGYIMGGLYIAKPILYLIYALCSKPASGVSCMNQNRVFQ